MRAVISAGKGKIIKMNTLKKIYEKHKEIILYLLFGVITTVCSLGACYLTLKLGVLVFHDENGNPTHFLDILGSTSQWIVGVLVSFFTNKFWVFKKAAKGTRATLRQLAIFSGSRVGTYFLEVAINLGVIALLDLLGYRAFDINLIISISVTSRVWAKILSSVFVVIANYFISKLIVFRNKKTVQYDTSNVVPRNQ